MQEERRSPLRTQDLLDRARAGRQGAWEELFRRYRALLTFTVRTRHGDLYRRRFDTDDVLQSAFLSAWAEIEAFEYRGEGSFRRWLARLVINKLRDLEDYHAAQRRSVRGEENGSAGGNGSHAFDELVSAERDPQERAGDIELRGALLEAMSTLDEEDQEVLCMRQFEHMTWPEVAGVLGVSQSVARRRWEAALERLTSAMP